MDTMLQFQPSVETPCMASLRWVETEARQKSLFLMMNLTFTLDEIQSVAKTFLQYVTNRKVFAFHGQMGVGKTTFIHALCNEWQVKNNVSSPTFSIINEYDGNTGRIFHIDLYRLTDMEEAINAGVEDCISSGNRCLVEWPERAAAFFPEDTVHVHLHAINEQTRHIRIADKLSIFG